MSLTVGSLFSGIGGLDLGLERAGLKVIWQCEIDPFARKVLAKHWPGIPCYEDVRLIDGSVERPDLICGGFPCQDISYAGKGAGLSGERSGLWQEFARIVRNLRPRFVLVENVSALLVRGIGDVLGTLASIGYDSEWSIVSACAMGAPHTRERLFIISNSDGMLRQTRMGFNRNEFAWLQSRDTPEMQRHWLEAISRNSGSADGISDWMDRCRTLGNAVCPSVGEFIGRRIISSLGA